MRRPRNILATLATVMSAGLFFGIGVLWVRSHWVEYGVYWWRADGNGSLYIEPGRFHWHVSPGPSYMYRGDESDVAAIDLIEGQGDFPMIGRPSFRFAGFGYAAYPNGPKWDREAIAPLWVAMVLQAIPPLVHVRRRRRVRRLSAGCCIACGYDLRASPHRCPECGAVPTAVNSMTVRR